MTKLTRGPVARTAGAYDNFAVGQGTAPVLPAALAARPTPIVSVSIQHIIGGQDALFVGNQFNQYRGIAAGAIQVIDVCDLSLVYVRSTGGAAVYNWIAYT